MVELGDVLELVFEAGGWGVEWSAGGVVEEEVVEADVEGSAMRARASSEGVIFEAS